MSITGGLLFVDVVVTVVVAVLVAVDASDESTSVVYC